MAPTSPVVPNLNAHEKSSCSKAVCDAIDALIKKSRVVNFTKSLDENPILWKISRKEDLARSASDSTWLAVDCKEMTVLQKVDGDGNEFAVALSSVDACGVSSV